MWGSSLHLHRRDLPLAAFGRKDFPCRRKDLPRSPPRPHNAFSPPHHTRWINAYQLARAAVPSPVTNVIPDPTKPNLPSQPGQDGGCPQILDSGEIMGKASGNLGYMPLLYPAKRAGNVPWRIDICLFGLLSRLLEVWAGFQGWKPMVAALFPRPIDHHFYKNRGCPPVVQSILIE